MKATWEPATGQDCGMMILNSESREDRLALNIFLRELKKGSKLKISGITYDGDGAGPCSTSIGWQLEEPASPPRAPGAPLPPTGNTVAIEAVPGQPQHRNVHLDKNELLLLIDAHCLTIEDCERSIADQAAEITRLRAQVQTERRAGIEAAAQWHSAEAVEWDNERGVGAREYAKQHRADAAAIRALADKPTWGEQT